MRIKRDHTQAVLRRTARVVLGSSVIRVFRKGTSRALIRVLEKITVSELAQLRGQDEFRKWFEANLNTIARAIMKLNPKNKRIHPGYKWGHAGKILAVFVRDIVLHTRYFTDAQVRRIGPWLFVPIDSIVMNTLRQTGCHLPFRTIKEIDCPGKFYGAQRVLGDAAARVGVPRVWFDDVWADRRG